MKGAGHPSVNICALCLQVLVRVMPLVSSLSLELLPILQRRAITPHHITEGTIRLDASDVSGVNFHEFQNFRATVLSDALIVCWRGCGKHYMDSCSSAVEEFCSLSSSVSVSLQLEAALFCLEQIARAASDSLGQFEHHEQMRRLFVVLPTQPPSLMANPLTREGMCRFLRKVSDSLIFRLIPNYHCSVSSLLSGSFFHCSTQAGVWRMIDWESLLNSQCHRSEHLFQMI